MSQSKGNQQAATKWQSQMNANMNSLKEELEADIAHILTTFCKKGGIDKKTLENIKNMSGAIKKVEKLVNIILNGDVDKFNIFLNVLEMERHPALADLLRTAINDQSSDKELKQQQMKDMEILFDKKLAQYKNEQHEEVKKEVKIQVKEEVERNIALLQKQVRELEVKKEKTELELGEAKNELADWKKKYEDQESELKEVNAENKKVNEENATVNAENKKVKEENATVNAENKKVKEENAQLKKDLKNKEKAIKTLEAEVEKIKEQLQIVQADLKRERNFSGSHDAVTKTSTSTCTCM